MTQTWHHLLFAHWPVSAAALRPHIPAGLEIDLLDGQAWLGLVVFSLSGIRLRGLPALPFVSAFPEINVRTYVRGPNGPGVLFLTMDADNQLGIALAKRWYKLPYYRARMDFAVQRGRVTCTSRRVEGAPAAAHFAAQYAPCAAPGTSRAGSLDHWLTERYRMYASDGRGGLTCGEIDHPQWPLQAAQAEIGLNTLASALDIPLPPMPPLLHYARHIQALFWWPRQVRAAPATLAAPALAIR